MRKLLFLILLIPSLSFAWFDNECKTISMDDTCFVLCYINATPAITKLHDGICKNNQEQRIIND